MDGVNVPPNVVGPIIDRSAAIWLQYGFVGLMALVFFVLFILAHRRMHELIDKRHEEMKALAKAYQETIHENTRTLDALTRAIDRADRRE